MIEYYRTSATCSIMHLNRIILIFKSSCSDHQGPIAYSLYQRIYTISMVINCITKLEAILTSKCQVHAGLVDDLKLILLYCVNIIQRFLIDQSMMFMQ